MHHALIMHVVDAIQYLTNQLRGFDLYVFV